MAKIIEFTDQQCEELRDLLREDVHHRRPSVNDKSFDIDAEEVNLEWTEEGITLWNCEGDLFAKGVSVELLEDEYSEIIETERDRIEEDKSEFIELMMDKDRY